MGNGVFDVTLADKIAGEDLTNDVMKVERQCLWQKISATTNIKAAPGRLMGFYCNTTSGGTVVFYNHASADTTPVIGALTPVAATYYPMPDIVMSVGIRATIAAAALDITVFYQ